MTLLKTEYERVMEQFEKEGRLVVLSPEKSLAIVADINEGMHEFLRKDRFAQAASARDLRHLILNA